MAVISREQDVLTLIIVIDVKPQNFDALLNHIERETDGFMRRQPGFISANLHRNAEKTRIVNYGQWESQALYREARSRDEFKALSKTVEELAERIDAAPYDLVYTNARQP